jgi:DNA primase
MNAAPLDDRVPDIRRLVDLAALVAGYAGPAARVSGGVSYFHCPDPEHLDRDPSFTVSDNRWRCWSQCATGGDAIDLLIWLGQARDKADAIDQLARQVGLERVSQPRSQPVRTLDRDRSGAILSRFLEQRGWPNDLIGELGLSVVIDKGGHPRVRFPFRLREDVVAWQDRAVHSNVKPRWLSSAGPTPCPYEVNRLRRAKEVGQVLVVEGISDAAAVIATFKQPAVVGIPGTCGFKPKWTPAFAGLDVLLVGDRDAGGERFRANIVQRLKAVAADIHHIRIPEPWGDLDEWRRGCGHERFGLEFEAADALAEGRP